MLPELLPLSPGMMATQLQQKTCSNTTQPWGSAGAQAARRYMELDGAQYPCRITSGPPRARVPLAWSILFAGIPETPPPDFTLTAEPPSTGTESLCMSHFWEWGPEKADSALHPNQRARSTRRTKPCGGRHRCAD
jgi:hypothetical protein